jgi:hypothetical protein
MLLPPAFGPARSAIAEEVPDVAILWRPGTFAAGTFRVTGGYGKTRWMCLKPLEDSSMGRTALVALIAAGAALATGSAASVAQQSSQPVLPPIVGGEPPAEAASPRGTVYIPGVGFRFIAPGGPRVYGWVSGYRAPVYGYRRGVKRGCYERDWRGDRRRCGRGWY